MKIFVKYYELDYDFSQFNFKGLNCNLLEINFHVYKYGLFTSGKPLQ